mmetsp:Transcript_514/g.1771  ORF Transcript_514/g.1771 Transcript_514/m.1771 type:complete len:351 (-) Transcript_514:2920-3972(-)
MWLEGIHEPLQLLREWSANRSHCAGAFRNFRHGAATPSGKGTSLLKRKSPADARSHNLANAVSEHHCRRRAEASKNDLRDGILHRKERRLHKGCIGEGFRCGLLSPTAVKNGANIVRAVRFERLQTLFESLAVDGFPLPKRLAHLRELRALAGEHERHRRCAARRALAALSLSSAEGSFVTLCDRPQARLQLRWRLSKDGCAVLEARNGMATAETAGETQIGCCARILGVRAAPLRELARRSAQALLAAACKCHHVTLRRVGWEAWLLVAIQRSKLPHRGVSIRAAETKTARPQDVTARSRGRTLHAAEGLLLRHNGDAELGPVDEGVWLAEMQARGDAASRHDELRLDE